MKLLVITPGYPSSNDPSEMMYVHVRNLYYKRHDIDVTVLNFKAATSYEIDGITVISLDEYVVQEKFDILVCHAPNIRNTYRFLKKFEIYFKKIVFFFHGHEVLRINSVYPKPYPFQKQVPFLRASFQDGYDTFKLYLWRRYYSRLAYKSHFVFVSRWLFSQFIKWTRLDPDSINDKYSIIYNGVGKVFEDDKYDHTTSKTYDFITIRAVMDGSKYGIDIVNELAMKNPNLSFLLIGRGDFFNHVRKAENITWISRRLSHIDLIHMINQSRCGLLPTRQDTQGVMTCEMATFGIPVITSDIEICHEVFAGFENVKFISNETPLIDLQPILKKLTLKLPYSENTKYFSDNTSGKEVRLFEQILQETH